MNETHDPDVCTCDCDEGNFGALHVFPCCARCACGKRIVLEAFEEHQGHCEAVKPSLIERFLRWARLS